MQSTRAAEPLSSGLARKRAARFGGVVAQAAPRGDSGSLAPLQFRFRIPSSNGEGRYARLTNRREGSGDLLPGKMPARVMCSRREVCHDPGPYRCSEAMHVFGNGAEQGAKLDILLTA
jgi:hypothetical protein